MRKMFTEYWNKHEQETGLSKFCDFRPKWCVNVGATGMDSICACTVWQNIKLMMTASSSNMNDYKQLLGKVACNL